MKQHDGILYLDNSGNWYIAYNFHKRVLKISVYRDDVRRLENLISRGVDVPGQVVFEIVNEFSHPELFRGFTLFDSKNCARIIFDPELIQYWPEVENREAISFTTWFKNLLHKLFKK
jgi:hypothetical protein